MTIDEAIKHCLEVAEAQEEVIKSRKIYVEVKGLTPLDECRKIAADHRQLAEWLTELKEARRLLKTADVQPVNQWISVDEALPIYDGLVLAVDKNNTIRLGIYTDLGWTSQFGNPMVAHITHWRPLPEPPKDGDTNG